jgi:hypothetical protein
MADRYFLDSIVSIKQWLTSTANTAAGRTFTAGVDEEIALPGVELGGCDHLQAQYFTQSSTVDEKNSQSEKIERCFLMVFYILFL